MRFVVPILVFWSCCSFAQTSDFYVKPADSQYFADDVVLMPDQSVLVSGALSILSSPIRKPFLLKLDPNGDVQWEKTYVLDNYADLHRLEYCQNGDLVGLIEQGDFNYSVVKFDSLGDIKWAKQFQYDLDPGTFQGQDLVMCSDGSVVTVGNYGHQGCLFGMTFHVARLSASGEVMWSKRYADSTFNPAAWDAYEVIQRSNGNLIIAFGGSRLVEMDLNGTILQESVVDSGVPRDCRIRELPDGTFIISGSNVTELKLTKVDAQLNVLWSYWYEDQNEYHERIHDIVINNGSIYLIGKVLSDNPQDQFYNRGFVAEFDFQGNLLGAHMSGRFQKDVHFAADLFPNGDLLLGGTSRSPIDNYSDISITRIPPSLISYCNHLPYSMQRTPEIGTASTIDFYYLEQVAAITPSIITIAEPLPVREDCQSTLSVSSLSADPVISYDPVLEQIEILSSQATLNSDYYLIDQTGRILKTGPLTPYTIISLAALPEGVYFIRSDSGISKRILHH